MALLNRYGQDIQRDVDMIVAEDARRRWPLHPYLPVKRYDDQGQTCAVIHEHNRSRVYFYSIDEITGSTMKMENFTDYDSPEDVCLSGDWIVD